MENKYTWADEPIGDCKITRSEKTFTQGDEKIRLIQKTEERSHEGVTILEKEKTRVATGKSGISIVHVNIVVENGVEKKVIEHAVIEKRGDDTSVKRRKRVLKQKKLIHDFEIMLMDDMKYHSVMRDEVLVKYEVGKTGK